MATSDSFKPVRLYTAADPAYNYPNVVNRPLQDIMDNVQTVADKVDANASVPVSTTLASLTDAQITTPSDGQSIRYDSALGKWKNASSPTGATFSTMPDSAVYAPTAGQLISYNGSKWQNVVAALSGVGLSVPATLDPVKKAAGATLSNNDLTVTFDGSGQQAIVGTLGHSTGKFYFEVAFVSGQFSGNGSAGIASSNVPLTQILGYNDNTGAIAAIQTGTIYNNNTSVGVDSWSTTGAVLGVAVDIDAKKAWFRVNAGVWNGSAANNPVTGVGGVPFTAVAPIFPAIGTNTAAVFTINMVSSGPTGYLPWATSGATPLFSDLAISNPLNGHTLIYDNASSKWKNTPVPAATSEIAPAGLYWRIYISAAQSGTSVFISEFTLRTSTLGAQAAIGGTASSSHNQTSFEPSKAFDGIGDSGSNGWFGSSLPANLNYQFPATTSLVEVVIRNSGGSGTAALGTSPKDFLIQYSNNNTDWTTVLNVTGATWTTYGESKTYSLPLAVVPMSISTIPGTAISSPTDGQLLKYNSATGKWVNATVAVPMFKSTILQRVATQTVGSNTWTQVSYDTVLQDDVGAFSAATPTQVTVPAGYTKVRITVWSVWASLTEGTRFTAIGKNGTVIRQQYVTANNESGATLPTRWLTVAPGDVLRVSVFSTAGASTTYSNTGGQGPADVQFEWMP